MKHRSPSGKLKSKHHSSIEGLQDALKPIEAWPEVEAIFPGMITAKGGHSAFRIKVQYPTDNGLKCLAVGTGGTQEVFVVTKLPILVGDRIRELYPLPVAKPKLPKPAKPQVELPKTKCGIFAFGKCRICVLCGRCANHPTPLEPCRVCPK